MGFSTQLPPAPASSAPASASATDAAAPSGPAFPPAVPLLGPRRVPIHIEARLAEDCVVGAAEVKAHIEAFLTAHVRVYRLGPIALGSSSSSSSSSALLTRSLASLVVAQMGSGEEAEQTAISAWRAAPIVHCYRFVEGQEHGGVEFALSDEDGGAPAAFSALSLPAACLEGLWGSIHVKPQIKSLLLNLAATSLLFAMRGVDANLVSSNRLILLHGEPGTGKTSLARGLAQQLAIRHSETFSGGVELLTINAHALLSKFFGESSGNVGRVITHVRERLADEPSTMFVLVIDEVETLVSSREAALARGSSEPGDAVRAVNATITELDRLKAHRNVLVVATSNLTGALDGAFLSRCDVRVRVGLPNAEGRYAILRSALVELLRAGIVSSSSSSSAASASAASASASGAAAMEFSASSSSPSASSSSLHPLPFPMRLELLRHAPQPAAQALLRLVEQNEGMSGRALRKLPLQAHAAMGGLRPPPVPVLEFLAAMQEVVAVERAGAWEQERAYEEGADDGSSSTC